MKKQSVPKRQLAALLLLAAGTIASHVSFFLSLAFYLVSLYLWVLLLKEELQKKERDHP